MTEEQADKMLYLQSCLVDLLARQQGIKAVWDEATQKVVEAPRYVARDEHGAPLPKELQSLGTEYWELYP